MRCSPTHFRTTHGPALEADEARHNLLLGILARGEEDASRARFWSLGPGARCAGQTPPHFIAIADLTEDDCDRLAHEVKDLDFLGCIGPAPIAARFAAALGREGLPHELQMPQRIHTLQTRPIYPGSPGHARPMNLQDMETYVAWTIAFCVECGLAEGPPSAEVLRAGAAERQLYFWEVDERPVAMASLTRETANGANISLVYTPPSERGRGYGGSITAHVADQIFTRGKRQAFLYTDLRNPVSNRVYEKIGFRPHCDTSSYLRLRAEI